ncbi:hypothetical protein WN51_05223 [Melipona quadrifasciata]|uniref:Uncharacterized protein n=1 Tax=Melipona quadrifasciata TaxID=166423 RepID=A0A0M8ZV69_9HYME|nr:hypothetical protein WN51_05223 [Melipona quadrifasciata]
MQKVEYLGANAPLELEGTKHGTKNHRTLDILFRVSFYVTAAMFVKIRSLIAINYRLALNRLSKLLEQRQGVTRRACEILELVTGSLKDDLVTGSTHALVNVQTTEQKAECQKKERIKDGNFGKLRSLITGKNNANVQTNTNEKQREQVMENLKMCPKVARYCSKVPESDLILRNVRKGERGRAFESNRNENETDLNQRKDDEKNSIDSFQYSFYEQKKKKSFIGRPTVQVMNIFETFKNTHITQQNISLPDYGHVPMDLRKISRYNVIPLLPEFLSVSESTDSHRCHLSFSTPNLHPNLLQRGRMLEIICQRYFTASGHHQRRKADTNAIREEESVTEDAKGDRGDNLENPDDTVQHRDIYYCRLR